MRLCATIVAATLLCGVAAFGSEDPAFTAKVLYVQELTVNEAVGVVRKEARVRRLVMLKDLNALVVAGTPDLVTSSTEALESRGALADSVEPHGHASQATLTEGATETRMFEVAGITRRDAVVVIRVIYGIAEMSELDDEHSIAVTATPQQLDMLEAFLETIAHDAG